jgi:DNA-binding XRE family transcriptional regulator
MSRPGRPEQPLNATGPISQLAAELRRVRNAAGLTYSELAAKTGLSVTTLRAAARGSRLPTWKVTRAFITACDGDKGTGWELWKDACRATGRPVPDEPPAKPPVPEPGEVMSAPQLIEMMKRLLVWADSPSLAKLNKLADGKLPTSTVNDMLRSERLPRLELMLAFVRACGLDEDQEAAWQNAWHLSKAQENDPPTAATQPLGSRLNAGRSLRMAIVAGSAAVVIAVVVTVLASGGLRAVTRDLGQPGPAAGPAGSVADQVVYTARTANDAAITLPPAVQQDLLQAGLAHQSIDLIRVGYTGDVSGSPIDMTPRTGNSPTDPPLRVSGRAVPAIDAKISGIQTAVNSAAAATGGGRALFVGLTRITFTSAPVIIISSGLDLANPDNFRALDWSVAPPVVVSEVEKAGDLPVLHGPVTFVLVPTAGPQPQLGQAQKNYIEAIWTALLKAAGATSVTFIDAIGTTGSSAAPAAPTVPVPALPDTPIPQVPAGNNKVTCTVPDSYFIFDTAALIDPAQTVQNLAPCIDAALAAHATFALDGWASYEGPLNADGQPEFNYPYNITLSEGRVQAIANLLVNDLGVPRSSITRELGHGNTDQPDPGNPGSAANRVVVITYTVK